MTSRVPSDILSDLRHILGQIKHSNLEIKSFTVTGGGCINESGRLHTSCGELFLKWNDRTRYPDMFEREADGLKLLREAMALQVPEVVCVGNTNAHQYLLLGYIASASRSASYWEDLGRGLAQLHQASSPWFGLEHDNYIGSLHQSNNPSDSWVTFFIEERLEKQLKLMAEMGYADHRLTVLMHNLYKRLPDLLSEERPALLHGDLWSGNVMVNEHGGPCLIDPAVYYGSREADLAMTRLFGGFAPAFYAAYQELLPLEKGFADRFSIYNLYPLMVHVNLFGGSYLGEVRSVLNRFAA